MSKNFLLGNMLSAIVNKSSFFNIPVSVEYSNLCYNVLNVMCNAGYIQSFTEYNFTDNIKKINIILAIDNEKKILSHFQLHSTPGCRRYVTSVDVKNLIRRNPYKLYIVSTSLGVMSAKEAMERNIGGELLCEIF